MKLHTSFLTFMLCLLSISIDVDAQQASPPDASALVGGVLGGGVTAGGGSLGQITSTLTGIPTASTPPSSMGADPTQETESTSMSANSPLNSIATPLGVDPKSMDAEIAIPTTPSTSTGSTSNTGGGLASTVPGPDLDLLWKCKKDSSSNKGVCVVAIQLFCSGRCTRINCMVPTNYVTCLDVCGEKATMMQPCVEAGKRNPGPAQIMNVAGAFDPSAPPPPPAVDPAATDDAAAAAAASSGGMAPGMNPAMGMAGAAMAMSPMGMAAMTAAPLAAAGIGAAAKGIGSLFGKKK